MRLVAILLALIVPAIGEDRAKHGTFTDEKIAVGGKTREYRLVVPDSLDLAQAAPIIFAFHGLGDSKDLMPRYSHLDDLAKKEKFLLVYPNGIDRKWTITVRNNADLDFFDALLAKISADYKIDPKRVYLTGMSDGAIFCNLLASQRSEKIAAIAPHSGWLGVLALRGINAKHKYPVFLIHGDADQIVKVELDRKTRDAYKREGHEIAYLEVAGLGHLWATKSDVNNKIWEFFQKHPIK